MKGKLESAASITFNVIPYSMHWIDTLCSICSSWFRSPGHVIVFDAPLAIFSDSLLVRNSGFLWQQQAYWNSGRSEWQASTQKSRGWKTSAEEEEWSGWTFIMSHRHTHRLGYTCSLLSHEAYMLTKLVFVQLGKDDMFTDNCWCLICSGLKHVCIMFCVCVLTRAACIPSTNSEILQYKKSLYVCLRTGLMNAKVFPAEFRY